MEHMTTSILHIPWTPPAKVHSGGSSSLWTSQHGIAPMSNPAMERVYWPQKRDLSTHLSVVMVSVLRPWKSWNDLETETWFMGATTRNYNYRNYRMNIRRLSKCQSVCFAFLNGSYLQRFVVNEWRNLVTKHRNTLLTKKSLTFVRHFDVNDSAKTS